MTNSNASMLYAQVVNCRSMARGYDVHGRDCSLFMQGSEFVMVKQGSPSHRLDAANTNAERLAAHWAGFLGGPAPVAPAPAPKLVAGDQIDVERNQGCRDAQVLAVIGDEALVSYEMPSGVSYLNVVAADGSDEPGKYRAVSRKGLPAKWKRALLEQFEPVYGPAVVIERRGNQFQAVDLVEG